MTHSDLRLATANVSTEAPVRFALLGTQGPLPLYTCTLLRNLVISENIRDFREFWPQNLSETEAFLHDADKNQNFLVGAQFPDRSLIDWLARERIPTLIALDAPVTSVAWWMEALNADLLNSIPPITRSFAMIAEAVNNPYCAVITHSHAGIRLEDLFQHVGKFCLGRPPRNLSMIFQRLELPSDATLEQAIAKAYPRAATLPKDMGLTGKAREEVAMVCNPLLPMVQGQIGEPMRWPPSMFLDGRAYRRPAPAIQELVGPARCLYYGPYLYLPRGHYAGEVAFGISSEIRDMYLRIEAVSGESITDFSTRARKGGLYTLPFEFSHDDASQHIEVRVLIDRGEIEGYLGLAHVSITPTRLAVCS